jgi:hypothetical protein
MLHLVAETSEPVPAALVNAVDEYPRYEFLASEKF